MNVTTGQLPADLFHPRSLDMLMRLYESNYQRLLDLLGNPAVWADHVCLHLENRPNLHVEVRRRTRHTVDVVMTHYIAEERLPDLSVRLYRDAHLAEATPLSDRHIAHRPLARLPHRWRANLLLYKWLEYCIDAPSKSAPAKALA